MVFKSLTTGKHPIGHDYECFIIAEAGVNHNGSIQLAKDLIDVAAEAGADAVKFQTFKAENLVTTSAPMANYQKLNTGKKQSQFEMLQTLELDDDAHEELITYADSKKITFLSTPFSEESADLLIRHKLPLFKIPSGEITNIPFLRYLARTGKPLILSTGMSTLGEVEKAVQIFEEENNQDYALLHCTSNYPAPFESVNLKAMNTLRQAFRCPVGYSDHTVGIEVSIAAAALGASIIEKHFTLDKQLPGPDHKASLEPKQLRDMVSSIRNIAQAMGSGIKRPTANEMQTAAVARKSIVAAQDIPLGAIIGPGDLRMLRPGTGLHADFIPLVIGKKAQQLIPAGQLISLDMLK